MHEKEGGKFKKKNSLPLQGDSGHQRRKTMGLVVQAVILVLGKQTGGLQVQRQVGLWLKQTMKKNRSIWSSWKFRI